MPERRTPRWTRARLARVLALTFGANSRGGPDTRAAAAALGVSQRTVQRWLHGPARRRSPISAAHLEHLTAIARPDEEVLRQEDQAARYARDAIEQMALSKERGVLPAWRKQRWLEPHLVAVVELPGVGLCQVAVARVGSRAVADLDKRGLMLAQTTVGSRFHATALVHEVLTLLGPWRLQAPVELVKQGRTQTWTADAPQVDLERLAVTHGLG